MYSEVAWVLISSRTQVQPQITLKLEYLPDYLSVSYDYDLQENLFGTNFFFGKVASTHFGHRKRAVEVICTTS